MASRSYYLHQARVCQSLARSAVDPALKDRYSTLALDFLDKASETEDEDDGDIFSFLTALPKKPDSGDMNPEE
jgi:hypothetical protein